MMVLPPGYVILVGLKVRDLDLIEMLATSFGIWVGTLTAISVALNLTGSVVKDPDCKQLKVVLVHNSAMWYRLPFFKALAQLYDLVIFFTDASSVEGLEGVNYEILRRPLKSLRAISFLQADVFVPGLVFRLMVRDYDVVVGGLFDIASFVIAKMRRKPFILWSETWHFSERESFTFRLLCPLLKFFISHADAVLVPSQMHKKETISLGARDTKTFIMPNVSNVHVISSDYRKAEELGSKLALKGKRIILYVGRLIESKGVQYLIEAVATLVSESDDIALVCVGGGPFREQLELLCKELRVGERVLFSGRVDLDTTRNAYLVPYFLLCDVCVVPSFFLRGMPDPCPLVVNSAMNCGKAVIATTAVGCVYDKINNGFNGFIVPEKDSGALYAALKAVLADPATAKAMGEASREVIEAGFTYSHMIRGFQKAISSLMVRDKQSYEGSKIPA
jgi:glycosyltransferase involved in cell wall biosynthesis